MGYQLGRVQQGLEPRDWKPMPAVGPGVVEIRVHAENEYRVLYLARRNDAVHVLHAFVKKTRKTPKADIELARRRYRELTQSGGAT
jgi:phage-related protein